MEFKPPAPARSGNFDVPIQQQAGHGGALGLVPPLALAAPSFELTFRVAAQPEVAGASPGRGVNAQSTRPGAAAWAPLTRGGPRNHQWAFNQRRRPSPPREGLRGGYEHIMLFSL